jgi:hypothetical protein
VCDELAGWRKGSHVPRWTRGRAVRRGADWSRCCPPAALERGTPVSPRPRRPGDAHLDSEPEEVFLVGDLAEFRTALRQEIEAARRASAAGAIPLVQGRRIGQLGNAYQYLFEVENALNLPGDAPGDLIVGNQLPREVTVIAVEGLNVTLSVNADLGAFVPSARLVSNLAHLMRKLIERIESLREEPNEPGERILGNATISGEPEEIEDRALNRRQREAVSSALGRDTTFIWGPPGTGKTKTIGAIGGHLADLGSSALMVSHTNTAVDQALLQIAERVRATDPELLAAGKVLRVGQPRDQRVSSDSELLLSTHVDRRSAELVERRDQAEADREVAVRRVTEVSRLVDIAEWIEVSAADIAQMQVELERVHDLEASASEIREEANRLGAHRTVHEQRAQAAHEAIDVTGELATCASSLAEIESEVDTTTDAVKQLTDAVSSASAELETAQRLEPLRTRLDALPSSHEAETTASEAREIADKWTTEAAGLESALEEARALLEQTNAVGGLARRWKRLPAPEVQEARVGELETDLARAREERDDAMAALSAALGVVAEIEDLVARVAGFEHVHRLEAVQRKLESLGADLQRQRSQLSEAQGAQHALKQLAVGHQQTLDGFAQAYDGADPSEVEAEAHRKLAAIAQADNLAAGAWRDANDARSDLEATLRERLAIVRDWGLTRNVSGRAEELCEAIEGAVVQARALIGGHDLAALRREHGELQAEIKRLDALLEEIAEQLSKLEEVVVADALVVATTLTSSYLRDSVWNRSYDTVILDEASMAQIPALYAAASRSERGVVVVGDFLQLPPIVISRDEEAQKWLGRDVFEVAELNHRHAAAEHFVGLERQYRMHPEISAITNSLIYEGHLVDDEAASSDDELRGWYRHDWGHDAPVLLVDTGPTNAWVTSVPRGSGSSRLNFLSATVCVDLAETFLAPEREPFVAGTQPRIAIICPYRPHAQLLELLLRDHGLAGEVVAGTAHNFQGTEAPIVILDLVNDEPHWKVALFMAARDEEMKRILNVAVTRARRRLVVVGDFAYMASQSKKAFLGKRFIPTLTDGHERVSALDVVPVDLGVRAAQAQSAVAGGAVEPDRDRLVMTQEHFYPRLRFDLEHARRRVVIYSPFITENRIGELHTALLSCVDRAVQVFVVTKTQGERSQGDRATYGQLINTLESWGVIVIPKKNMHEKLVFVDDDVLWSGSLNPLSYSNTQEIMERRQSKPVSSDFQKTLRMGELVAEYQEGPPRCPICGHEMVATEGVDDPYYWKCSGDDDCYKRSIDEEKLTDEIRCRTCGGEVEFGAWGERDAWRCKENYRHRIWVSRSHLRLPKMAAIVPKADLRRMCKKWGLDPETLNPRAGRLF